MKKIYEEIIDRLEVLEKVWELEKLGQVLDYTSELRTMRVCILNLTLSDFPLEKMKVNPQHDFIDPLIGCYNRCRARIGRELCVSGKSYIWNQVRHQIPESLTGKIKYGITKVEAKEVRRVTNVMNELMDGIEVEFKGDIEKSVDHFLFYSPIDIVLFFPIIFENLDAFYDEARYSVVMLGRLVKVYAEKVPKELLGDGNIALLKFLLRKSGCGISFKMISNLSVEDATDIRDILWTLQRRFIG